MRPPPDAHESVLGMGGLFGSFWSIGQGEAVKVVSVGLVSRLSLLRYRLC